jgi:hypothetical protein
LPELLRFEAFGLGCFLSVFITFIHVTGLDGIVGRYRRKANDLQEKGRHPLSASWYFGFTILQMLLLHIGDLCIWTGVLFTMKLVPNIHDALYFCANTYTSLGYGDVPLTYNWRELSPLMAVSGLFTFACTTSQLFNVMGFHHDVLTELTTKHKKKHAVVI